MIHGIEWTGPGEVAAYLHSERANWLCENGEFRIRMWDEDLEGRPLAEVLHLTGMSCEAGHFNAYGACAACTALADRLAASLKPWCQGAYEAGLFEGAWRLGEKVEGLIDRHNPLDPEATP